LSLLFSVFGITVFTVFRFEVKEKKPHLFPLVSDASRDIRRRFLSAINESPEWDAQISSPSNPICRDSRGAFLLFTSSADAASPLRPFLQNVIRCCLHVLYRVVHVTPTRLHHVRAPCPPPGVVSAPDFRSDARSRDAEPRPLLVCSDLPDLTHGGPMLHVPV
jgi:hypothetical protein